MEDGLCRWTGRCLVMATEEELFEFHSDPRKMPEVMPPMPGLRWLQIPGPPAVEGEVMAMQCRLLGVTLLNWRGRWRRVQRPKLLIDEMLVGPLESFEHEHRFEAAPHGGCWLEDRVTFRVGHSLAARCLGALMQRVIIPLLFSWRHWRTRVWAQKKRATPASWGSAQEK